MRLTGIYKIQSKCKPDRFYIGSAINIKQRWAHHISDFVLKKHRNQRFQNHVNKYGITDLEFSVILGCEKAELLTNEQFFIDSLCPYFNICKIAGSPLGRKVSEEAKRKMSIAKKGEPLSADHKNKIRASMMGQNRRKRTEEEREKISLAAKGRVHTQEYKDDMSRSCKGRLPWNTGKNLTDEHKQKIKASCQGINKGRKQTIEARQKMSVAKKGKPAWNKGKKSGIVPWNKGLKKVA